MALISVVSRLVRVMVLLPIAIGFGTPALAQDAKPFSKEQLDQMTAQVALYPDSLLSQLFMATTYPDEFAKAYAWSKAHPDSKGDDAVRIGVEYSVKPASSMRRRISAMILVRATMFLCSVSRRRSRKRYLRRMSSG